MFRGLGEVRHDAPQRHHVLVRAPLPALLRVVGVPVAVECAEAHAQRAAVAERAAVDARERRLARAAAQGEAQAFDKVYEEYRLAPEVTKRRMYYETMEGVLRDTNTVVSEGNNVTPYLPLSEIRRRASSDSPGTTTTVTGQEGQ